MLEATVQRLSGQQTAEAIKQQILEHAARPAALFDRRKVVALMETLVDVARAEGHPRAEEFKVIVTQLKPHVLSLRFKELLVDQFGSKLLKQVCKSVSTIVNRATTNTDFNQGLEEFQGVQGPLNIPRPLQQMPAPPQPMLTYQNQLNPQGWNQAQFQGLNPVWYQGGFGGYPQNQFQGPFPSTLSPNQFQGQAPAMFPQNQFQGQAPSMFQNQFQGPQVSQSQVTVPGGGRGRG
ncbi:Hypp3981 [Branchiostoma lanceolatum]|uniref:Hypp3981 protein n=1 Tax=Branchiostoma lanceolatum TaxID=7740 RepID=A0A8K0A5Y7_BRALA|nr:Hypp3981 [Branchiostoma lanceolatum]